MTCKELVKELVEEIGEKMIDVRRINSWVTIGDLNYSPESCIHGEPGDLQVVEPGRKVRFMKDDKFHQEFIILEAKAVRRYKHEKEITYQEALEKKYEKLGWHKPEWHGGGGGGIMG